MMLGRFFLHLYWKGVDAPAPSGQQQQLDGKPEILPPVISSGYSAALRSGGGAVRGRLRRSCTRKPAGGWPREILLTSPNTDPFYQVKVGMGPRTGQENAWSRAAPVRGASSLPNPRGFKGECPLEQDGGGRGPGTGAECKWAQCGGRSCHYGRGQDTVRRSSSKQQTPTISATASRLPTSWKWICSTVVRWTWDSTSASSWYGQRLLLDPVRDSHSARIRSEDGPDRDAHDDGNPAALGLLQGAANKST